MKVIYQATSETTGKSYVGKDSNWPHRQIAHKHAAFTKRSNLIFHRALRKYGWDDFRWTVLTEVGDQDDLDTLEEEMIRDLGTHYFFGDGYNMTFGGEGTLGWIPSQQTRDKISEANAGKPAWNKGKPSPWTVEKNKASRGKPKPSLEKMYIVTDPEGNEFVIKGLIGFCERHNLTSSNMSSVARGKLPHHKKWQCRYA